ncbi:MAG: OstA-like protein [Saprospiraceae bacterium]
MAQESKPPRTQIYIVHADEWYYEEGDSSVVDQLRGNVNVRYDSVFLFCDTAFIHGKILKAIGHSALVQGDSLKIFADTLTYDSESGQADLLGRVLLVNGNQRLRTDSLHYDTRTKIATYLTGAFWRIWLPGCTASEAIIMYRRRRFTSRTRFGFRILNSG